MDTEDSLNVLYEWLACQIRDEEEDEFTRLMSLFGKGHGDRMLQMCDFFQRRNAGGASSFVT